VKLRVREYLTAEGRSPYREWLDTLDPPIRARIQARVLRFELGNLGDHKAVGQGVHEARLPFGSGYRVYFAMHGRDVVLLLVGGDKGTQGRDINQARKQWLSFLEATRHGKTK